MTWCHPKCMIDRLPPVGGTGNLASMREKSKKDEKPRARHRGAASGNSMEHSSRPRSLDVSHANRQWVVWEAYTEGEDGAAGVDAEVCEMFEQDLKSNLYRIWNHVVGHVASGPVGWRKRTEVSDAWAFPLSPTELPKRVKMYLESVEPQFHSAYGYRPRKSRRTQAARG